MADTALKLIFNTDDGQCPLTGTPGVIPSRCELAAGLYLEIHLQIQDSEIVYSVLCSSSGHMMILHDRNIGR
jgi:hypothetical protein